MGVRVSKALAQALAAGEQRQKAKAGSNKFGAVRTVFEGQTFDSKREAARFAELRRLERAGQITNLERQVTYDLTVAGVRIGRIKPDFRYRRGGELVVEDVKSKPTMTPMFRWKAKHLLAEHGVKLEIIQ